MQAPTKNVVNNTEKKEEQQPSLTVTLKQQ